MSRDIKIYKYISTLLFALIVIVIFFLLLINFKVISFNSSPLPETMNLNQNEIGIKVKENYQLVASVLPNDAYYGDITWTSSNPEIATVNEKTGYISALKVGDTVIKATTNLNSLVSECLVHVSGKDIVIESINITNTKINLLIGNTYTINYTVSPKNATTNSFIFLSSDTSVATVDSHGKITGKKNGTAIITIEARSGGVKDTVTVKVYSNSSNNSDNISSENKNTVPTSITVSKDSIELIIDGTNNIKTTVTPSNANQSVTWSSSNPRIATVDENGNIKGVSVGETTAIATTINGKTAVVNVKVQSDKVVLTDISFENNTEKVTLGQNKKLFVKFIPDTATNQQLNWKSSNEEILKVSDDGTLLPLKVGTVVITATSVEGKHQANITVEVKEPETIIPETEISFTTKEYSILINNTVTLTPNILPNNATYQTVIWSTSNRNVATVNDGLVYGLSEGTAIITAKTKYSALTSSVTIKVNAVLVSGVTLNISTKDLLVGETIAILANVVPSNATNKMITWTTSDQNIVTVDDKGIVKAIKAGRAYIEATTANGKKATVIIAVS